MPREAEGARRRPASSRSSGASKPSPSSAIVSTTRSPSRRRCTSTRVGVGVALDVGERLLEDPAQLAQRQRRQRPDVVERAADARSPVRSPQRAASERIAVGSGSSASSRPRRPLSSSRASCAAVRASAASLSASSTAPVGVDLDPARERERREADAVHGLGQRVVHVAREPLALGLRGQHPLLLAERGLGLGLAVQQPPRAGAGDGDDRIQRRQHDERAEVDQRGVERRAQVDRVARRRSTSITENSAAPGIAVDEPAEQRRAEREEEERAVDAGQEQDQRRQHELAGEVGRVADDRRADPVPAQDRDQRGDRRDARSRPPSARGAPPG